MLTIVALIAATMYPPVHVGRLDWDNTPTLRPRGTLSGIDANEGFRRIVRTKTCDLHGATETDFKHVRVHFAAFVHPNGAVEQIIVEDVGCLTLEKLVAAIALEITKKVDAPEGDKPVWLSSSVTFVGQQ